MIDYIPHFSLIHANHHTSDMDVHAQCFNTIQAFFWKILPPLRYLRTNTDVAAWADVMMMQALVATSYLFLSYCL